MLKFLIFFQTRILAKKGFLQRIFSPGEEQRDIAERSYVSVRMPNMMGRARFAVMSSWGEKMRHGGVVWSCVKGKRRLYLVERRCAIEQDRDVVPERHARLLTKEHEVDELVIELEIPQYPRRPYRHDGCDGR